jgi:UDP-N-acetylmuramate--alanine ligase
MKKVYHFIGIGGVGMSALARILLKKGELVSGSDIKPSKVLDELKEEGAKIFVGHDVGNVKNPYAVIYSTDIQLDNPEYSYAKREGIPLLHRSELLAQLMVGYAPLLVTGTHGKTTTVALLSYLLVQANFDPSFAVGGYLTDPPSNSRFGRGLYFASEADESDGSFLNYPSFGAIITNIEHDHMNFWKTEGALLKGFNTFASQVGSKEHLFWCRDDLLLKSLNLKGYSYGFHDKADLYIESFQQIKWKMSFDLRFLGKRYRNIEIPLIGAHNVLNSAAVFGMALKLDINEQIVREGLRQFKGVGRRLEKKGVAGDIQVYDDYAHHPTEIFATLRALRSALLGKRIIALFQPHRYSRTKYCLDDFAEAFAYADRVILTDIYAAGEEPLSDVTPVKVLERMHRGGCKKVDYIPRDKLAEHLIANLKSGDVLITMGAGDITALGPEILGQLQK